MTETTTAVNISFKPFNEDEITATEELLYINDRTIVFNHDLVATASLYPINESKFAVDMHLVDGRTVKRNFDVSNDSLVECETV